MSDLASPIKLSYRAIILILVSLWQKVDNKTKAKNMLLIVHGCLTGRKQLVEEAIKL